MDKILVIDDDDAVVLVLTMALERCGFDVEVAKDGVEGIKRFDEGRFDLVITDILMDKPDGHDVLSHIRKSHRKFTPTIGISATPMHLEESDFDAVFEKPFQIQPLIDTVNGLIRDPIYRETHIA
jgi:CheY-like chemotaxis protein